MPSITESSRARIKAHFRKEAEALYRAAFKAAVNYWLEAEKAAVKEYGLDDVAAELADIEAQVHDLRQRRSELRAQFPGIGEELTTEDYQRLGLEDEVESDHYRDEITSRPKVFDREIRTKWDGVIYEFLCKNVGLDRLRDVVKHAHNAAMRQLDLAGTHAEAQEAHAEWYKVLVAGMGADAPPLLADVVKQAPELLAGVRERVPLLGPGNVPSDTDVPAGMSPLHGDKSADVPMCPQCSERPLEKGRGVCSACRKAAYRSGREKKE